MDRQLRQTTQMEHVKFMGSVAPPSVGSSASSASFTSSNTSSIQIDGPGEHLRYYDEFSQYLDSYGLKYEPVFINGVNTFIFCPQFLATESGTQMHHAPCAQDAAGMALILPGAAEHSFRYADIIKTLLDAGFLVFGHDHQGTGLSGGDDGHIDTFSDYVTDVITHMDFLIQSFDQVRNLPFFILGHSMGATIALQATYRRPEDVSGLVLLSPALVPDPMITNPVMMKVGHLMGRLFPKQALGEIKANQLLASKPSRKAWCVDRIVSKRGKSIRAKQGFLVIDAMMRTQEIISELVCPMLIVHGTKDKIASFDGAKLIQSLNPNGHERQLHAVENGRHQPHHEDGSHGDAVRHHVCDWLVEKSREV